MSLMTSCRIIAFTLSIVLFATKAAAQCSVSANSVAFGDYDSLSGLSVNSVGSVTVTCALSLGYSIALSPGGAGGFSPRQMSNGAHSLNYNLYTNPTYLSVWGDGNSGTVTVSGAIGILLLPINHVVYGRIPAGQNSAAGSYTDTVSVTVTY